MNQKGTARFLRGILVAMLLSAIGMVISREIAGGNAATVAAVERGSISGTVSLDRGVVRAFRVKIRDTVHRISYTVYTRQGKYHIADLPPSTYQIHVMEKGIDSPTEEVQLKPGHAATVNVALRRLPAEPSKVQLVDFETLYPAGPGRDLLAINCMVCHGKNFFHRQRRSEEGWKAGVEAMTTTQNPKAYNGVQAVPGLSAQDKTTIIQYLFNNFGPNAPARDLQLDELEVNEEEVADAIFIEYDIPEPVKAVFREGGPQGRQLHDAYIALDGKIWFGDTGANSLLSLDPDELDFQKRWKEYPIPVEANVFVHGHVVDSRGRVYWAEIAGGHLGELDPKTGEMTRRKFPSLGSMLQVVVDSKDQVWFNLVYGSKIGKFNPHNRQFSLWEMPTRGADPYGLVVDQKGRIWAAGIGKSVIVLFDPETEKFTEYPTPTQPSGPRRLGVDSKGQIWFAEYFGNKLGVLNPSMGKIVEYDFPYRYTQAYEAWPDSQDNVWVTDGVYNSLIKFDQATKTFTYFPMPQFGYWVPKVEIDKEGAFWFGSRMVENITAVAFKPKGNSKRKM